MNILLKRIGCVLICILFIFSLCGCQSESVNTTNSEDLEQYELSLDKLKEELNKQRKDEIEVSLQYTIKDYGIVEPDEAYAYSENEVLELTQKRRYENKISLDEAIADVDSLMKLMKNSYGGYTYFGGDKQFLKAKEQIIERVHEAYDQGENLTSYLQNILLEELTFVEDSHFRIGQLNTKFNEKYIYYDLGKTDFYQDSNGYYTVIEDAKWYLSHDDEMYFHLTVSDNGELVYGLFILSEEDSILPKEFILNSENGKEYTMPVSFAITSVGQRVDNNQIHSSSTIEGIPVTTLGGMAISDDVISDMNDFINEAKELRNEKVFILDLRGNIGGLTALNDFFMYNLTNSRCPFKMQTAKRCSAVNMYHEMVNFQTFDGDNGFSVLQKIDFFNENKELVASWFSENVDFSEVTLDETLIKDYDADFTEYDNTIVVLIDKNVFSAGEYLIYQLATVENVIIMGSNSNGCMVTTDVNAMSPVYLPNSGISIMYGQSLIIQDKMNGFDTDGYMPDIITRGDALDAAVALLK